MINLFKRLWLAITFKPSKEIIKFPSGRILTLEWFNDGTMSVDLS